MHSGLVVCAVSGALFVSVEFDRQRTLYSVLRRHFVSERPDALLSPPAVMKSGEPKVGDRIVKPLGSNLAVNRVLRVTSQPRNACLTPLIHRRTLRRLFDTSSMTSSVDVTPVRLTAVVSGDVNTEATPSWTVCLRCLDTVEGGLQLPKIYYQNKVSIDARLGYVGDLAYW